MFAQKMRLGSQLSFITVTGLKINKKFRCSTKHVIEEIREKTRIHEKLE